MKGIDLHPQLRSQLPGENDEPGDGRRQALLLVAHDATADPRVEWMAAGLPADFEVCELCVYADELDAAGPSLERVSDRKTRVRVARRRHDWDAVPDIRRMSTAEAPGLHHLTLLHVLAELPSKPLQRAVGGLDADEEDLYRFRWLARYFLNTNSALIQAGRLLGQSMW